MSTGLELAFLLIGGFGIFIYGIHSTSDGLQKLAGSKMKWILTKLTTNRFVGTLVGAGTTAVLQSSSFVSVMVVGLVSAHLLNLGQAASLIVGMNLGTTITGQIIAFEVSALALPMIAVGVYMNLFMKRESFHFGGQALMGLGMLFLGLEFMKDAFTPLKESAAFQDFFVNYGSNVFLAVLIGLVATMIIQSSSALIGIMIALASSGLLTGPIAIAMILGSNIGTTITAQVAALSMNRTAKRAAMVHTIFNLIGVVWIMLVFNMFVGFIDWVTPSGAGTARYIANAHTFFNLFNVVVVVFLLPYLVRIVEWIIPDKKNEKLKGMYVLHKGFLRNPETALLQVKLACLAMFDVYADNVKLLKKYSEKEEAFFFQNEKKVNTYRENISKYLGKISIKDLTERQAQMIPVFLHLVNDIESMADCLKRIAHEDLSKKEKALISRVLADIGRHLRTLKKLLENPDRDKVIALEEDLIAFRLKKLDKLKGDHDYIQCLHEIIRKMANILVMTREI